MKESGEHPMTKAQRKHLFWTKDTKAHLTSDSWRCSTLGNTHAYHIALASFYLRSVVLLDAQYWCFLGSVQSKAVLRSKCFLGPLFHISLPSRWRYPQCNKLLHWIPQRIQSFPICALTETPFQMSLPGSGGLSGRVHHHECSCPTPSSHQDIHYRR